LRRGKALSASGWYRFRRANGSGRPGFIGSIQAIEAIKYLLGIGTHLTNALLTFDALTMNFRKVAVRRDPACPLCG
jgi:molybdopterin/thiamine biosynthesis adenylyltransferase